MRDELAERHAKRFEALRKTARSTRDDADAAAGSLRFLDRAIGALGFNTEAMRQADRLERLAEDAQRAFKVAGEAYGSELADEHSRAPAIARERKRQHDEWSQAPDVVEAKRGLHANGLIRAAVGMGDSGIERLAREDLQQVQREVLRREANRQSEERRLRDVTTAHQMRDYVGYVPAAGE